MNDDRDKTQAETPAKSGHRKEREARLAEALRANLKRRKAQERGRASGKDGEADESTPDKGSD